MIQLRDTDSEKKFEAQVQNVKMGVKFDRSQGILHPAIIINA
jgi:hypothetical protein